MDFDFETNLIRNASEGLALSRQRGLEKLAVDALLAALESTGRIFTAQRIRYERPDILARFNGLAELVEENAQALAGIDPEG